MATTTALVRIGKDAVLNHIQNGNGTAVANFTACYKRGRKDESGVWPVQWLDLSMFGVGAEKLVQYLLKGTLIYAVIEDLHIETYNRNDATQGHKLVGTVQKIEFAGGNTAQQAPQAQQQQRGAELLAPRDNFNDDFDDQIPY